RISSSASVGRGGSGVLGGIYEEITTTLFVCQGLINQMHHTLDSFWQDARQALRALRRDRGFTAVAALSLALAIGANTAIFSLIDALMLKSLPVSHPEQLLHVTMEGKYGYFSNPLWELIRDRQDVFSG